ncbi:hypothetical protein BZG36_05292 [Bifiguratus adelaidae]|uniref:protein kinase C n=1 Tax=Bifiguratus adelaidae TaxID=1938954 RepID=A0A261XTF4_9FUNG|nr:hypothetical protein BZG36_05292 [Bifiguratus adelaidae]
MSQLQARLQDLQGKINQHRVFLNKAIEVRGLLRDDNARAQCETEIRELQRSIDYFSEEYNRLQLKSAGGGDQNLTPTGSPAPLGAQDRRQAAGTAPKVPLKPSEPAGRGQTLDVEKRQKLSNLDLLKSETPINKAKVSLKLHELEYKLDVERKVQDGARKLAHAFGADTGSQSERKRRAEMASKLSESNEKVALLRRAVHKYKTLYIGEVDDDEDDIADAPGSRGVPGMRKPITGKLQVKIQAAQQLAHAPTFTFRSPETVIRIKVDGNIIFTTKPSKTDRWMEESEIHVDKASEVEILISDQSGERSTPIGILWLKITDIAEAIRRRKLELENGSGWVSAEVAQQHDASGHVSGPGGSMGSHGYGSPGAAGAPGMPGQPYPVQPYYGQPYPPAAYGAQSYNQYNAAPSPALNSSREQSAGSQYEGIEAWFDVEPVGQVLLSLNFIRESAGKRPMDKLGRAGAVRQRKEEIHEMNGHKFVEKKFMNIMRCALCGDFMVNTGYQCEDCEYCCHRKCYQKVVTKCISKANSETDPDVEKLNHRIPHRFEPITNIGANWCCHCGYMLALGTKSSKRCTECGIACHTKCAHLVPDFCGMSMEMANQMLAEIKAARRRTAEGQVSTPNKLRDSGIGQSSQPSQDSLASQMSSMALGVNQNQQRYGQPMQQRAGGYDALHTQGHPPYPQPSGAAGQSTAIVPGPAYNAPQAGPTYDRAQHLPPSPTPPRLTSIQPPMSHGASQQMPPGQQVQMKQPGKPPVQAARNVGLDDFNFLAVLGKGNFGKVMLAEEKFSKELYAIKVLKKRFIIDNDEVASTRSEKRTESRIYFVMEYVSGGDLMLHIQREQFSERRAKFYACEVLLALEYLHKQGIVYRDLKLDNILLTLDGHIKIADYGLCKENMWYGATTNTFCGTPEFMAPEILLEQRYGRAVDWWAFGVLIYEMLLGQSPFRGEDEDEIFDAILEDEILYPINMSRDSVSICTRLLNRDPERRLGSSKADAEEIKRHPFFRGVNWDDMLAKKVPPPFYPSINGRIDTSNFDEEFTREIPVLTPVQSMLSTAEQEEFKGFSHIADWVLQGDLPPEKW